MTTYRVGVVGNPNSGKTTLFNALTGARQEVGNWPGVTVDKKVGHFTHKGVEIELVDLPGIYSITPASTAGEDERIARDYILSGEAACVVNIIDASNLERNLYLTSQLIEMQVPMLAAVNMLDIAKARRTEVEVKAIEDELGCPAQGIVASTSEGLEAFKDKLVEFLSSPSIPPVKFAYPEAIEKAKAAATGVLETAGVPHAPWLALQLVEEAPGVAETLPDALLQQTQAALSSAKSLYPDGMDVAVAATRYDFVTGVARRVTRRTGVLSQTATDRIDRVVLDRWLGFPIFLLCMYVMFLFTQNLGGAFIDFFDILVGGVMVDGLGQLLEAVGSPQWLKVVLADGVGMGVQTVATFIPPIFFLFLFLSIMEHSGYMARAAFIMDRFMHAIGLPGRAFVPLLVGFGCGVPAIMATRTMDRASDRITTIMMAPFMSCGARLPIYVLFAAVFWPTNGQNLVFALYLAGIAGAVFTGFLIKRFALPDESGAFIMEIPPYHVPSFKGVMLRTWDRLKSFILRAGKLLVVICAVIGILHSMGTDGTFGNEDSDKSVLSAIGQSVAPVLAPMGVSSENWPAAVGIFTGILAKEAVIGTMSALYEGMIPDRTQNVEGETQEEPAWSLGAVLSEALEATAENLAGIKDALTDPLGIGVDEDLTIDEERAEALATSVGAAGVMARLFGSKLAAFAYLLMCLFYMPCGAAVAAVYREAGPRWTLFLCAWTTAFGYCAATIVYRVGSFAESPLNALASVAVSAIVFAVMILWMKSFARRHPERKIIPIRVA